jgi:hypothetical protein
MMFVLTCALCATQPALTAGGAVDPGGFQLLEERLSLRNLDAAALPPPALTLALDRIPYEGSGDGEDHSGHMGPMWIVMGAMMVVMMVGVGVYAMRQSSSVMQPPSAALPSPAQVAVPLTDARGGGG